MHACMHDNNNKDPPVRQSSELTAEALTTGYPVQPDGLDPDRAFNLALDRALALLPTQLRRRADVPFYTLAAELHPAALEHPSRAWPDAGGAGWVLDAVVDAIANGPVGSVNLIRTITDRWLVEGNPYAVRPEGESSANRAQDPTVEMVWAVIEGGTVVPPLVETSETTPTPQDPVRDIPPDLDPLLGEVIRRYEAEIGTVTEGVAQRLLALTEEHRNPDRWQHAFDAVVRSNVRRLDYLEACLENGRAKSKSQAPRRKRSAAPSTRSERAPTRIYRQRGRVVSLEEMPEVEPEAPLPPP
jgi:hypothetical protein